MSETGTGYVVREPCQYDVSERAVRRMACHMHIVQFIHSWEEHTFPIIKQESDGRFLVPWNGGKHHRRLVKHFGDYVEGNLRKKGLLTFWTEWEAPTFATDVRRLNGEAKFIHEVRYPTIPSGNINGHAVCSDNGNSHCSTALQNTDPCVFGSSFKYSNCLQSQKRRHTFQNLEDGSMLVFVSRHSEQWYLDTVLVTHGECVSYVTPEASSINCSPVYRKLTLDRIPPGERHYFYRGVTCSTDEVARDGVFSYTPARKYSGDRDDCKRCRLDLQGINAAIGRNIFSISKPQGHKPIEANAVLVRRVWQEIKDQVTGQDFVLGVHFDWPSKLNK